MGNNIGSDLWWEVELLAALEEQETNRPALNYSNAARRFGAGGTGGSCERGEEGTMGREDSEVHAGVWLGQWQ